MTYKYYTQNQLDFVRDNKHLPLPELTEKFNKKFGESRSKSAIGGTRKRNKWHSGNSGQFQKGQTTWNKGKKGLTHGSSTSFKKGNVPKNHVPVGTERYTTGDKYVKVKIAEPNKWQFKHLLVWEKYFGSVPKNHTVIFIDGNRNNCDISNLLLATRAELLQMNRNKMGSAPAELKPVIQTMSKLEVQVFQKTKSFQNKKG